MNICMCQLNSSLFLLETVLFQLKKFIYLRIRMLSSTRMIRLVNQKFLASYIMRALVLRFFSEKCTLTCCVGLFLIFLKSFFYLFCFQVLRALTEILLFVQMKIALAYSESCFSANTKITTLCNAFSIYDLVLFRFS